MSRIKVAIGPIHRYPSWQWIGPDTTRELSQYFDVVNFEKHNVPECDVALFIKQPLSDKSFGKARKFIYLPVDGYKTQAEIADDAKRLSRCSAVLLHSERLRLYLAPHNPNLWPIDHHNKYGLEHGPAYRNHGYVLWVGAFQNVPYLMKWLESRTLPSPLIILTNYHRSVFTVKHKARKLARSLGIRLHIQGERLNGYPMAEWSPEAQTKLMAEAKATIDIKGTDFNQMAKPPTKAQKFIASGIPFATNAESYACDYFKMRGLNLADADDSERWLSREYWQETSEEAARLKEDLSLKAVGLRLKDYIEKVA